MIIIARFTLVILIHSCFMTLTVLGSSRSCDGGGLSFPGCGIIPSTSTINNGEPASYPWMAFLFYSSIENGDTSFCGASLISDIQLITAAHCVSGKTTDEVAVLIGNPNATYELIKMNFKFLFKIEIPPFYRNYYRHDPDVAVLTLEEPLILNYKITPICLPSIDDAIKTYEGVTATVAGWGKTQTRRTSTDQLLKVDVPVLSNRECQAFYRWIKSFHLCTHEPETRSGHCQGDSGGPLFLLDSDNRYVQIGVASFGSIVDCGLKPGGFARMTYDVLQWIRTVKVDSWQQKIERKQHKMEIEQHKMRLELQKGVWCGYQDEWKKENTRITYDKLLHSSTNMENPGVGLDTQSGVFTVPVTGVWRIFFSLKSGVNTGQENFVSLYHNQEKIEESRHASYSQFYWVASTGGRELIMKAEQGDTVFLGTEKLDNGYYGIITCFEFESL